MVASAFLLAPSVLSNEVAFSIAMGDLLLKSLLVVFLAVLLTRKCIAWLGNAGVYALWITALISLLLIPLFSGQINSSVVWTYGPVEPLSLLTIPLYQDILHLGAVAPARLATWLQGLLFVYFTVLFYLLLSLWVSIRQVGRIVAQGNSGKGTPARAILDRLTEDLKLPGPIRLCISDEIEAPFSFSLRQSVIVLPESALDWQGLKLESVLVHELSHIRRHDCRVLLFCQLAAYVYWFNPFVWYVFKKVRNAAEFNCDDGVLSRGTSHIRYAQELVDFARHIMDSRKRRCFVQYMIDARDIRVRIENIMQRRPVKKAFSGPVMAHCLLLVLIASAIGMNTNIISTRYHDFIEASRLVYSEQPVYPLTAYQDGVQGWVLVNFDIDNLGRVEQESVDIQFSQPQGVFEDVSLQSLNTFRFEARRINGEAVSTTGLRYMFRYRLPNG